MKTHLLLLSILILLNGLTYTIHAQSLTDSLVAYYEFSGNSNDATPNQIHGTSYGASYTTDRWGNDSSAINFTGNTNPPYSYVQTPDAAVHEPANHLTAIAWAKYTDTTFGIQYPTIFSKRHDDFSPPYDSYGIYLDNFSAGSRWTARLSTANITDEKLVSLNPVQLNQWSHFALTYGDDTLKFYIDGQLQGAKYVTGNIIYSALGFRIGTGRPNATNVAFTGNVDEVRIYNRVLSAAEINQLFSGAIKIAGNIHTETGTPVKGVTVNLAGSSGGNFPTASNGDYDYNIVPNGNYTVTPSKNNDVAVSNGISTLDILLVQRHILGTVQLSSPYKIIAADVNGSQSVSTLDVLLMRALVLGNATSFPGGNLWKFVSSDFVFTNPLSPFPFDSFRSYTNVTISHTGQDFIGIKLGDINNSWDSNVP